MEDLKIPQEINLYEKYIELAKEDKEAKLCLEALHETFEKFEIKESAKEVGNIILRFSHLVGKEEKLEISDDPTMNFIADMYEYFAKIASQKLEDSDEKVSRNDSGGIGSKFRVHR